MICMTNALWLKNVMSDWIGFLNVFSINRILALPGINNISYHSGRLDAVSPTTTIHIFAHAQIPTAAARHGGHGDRLTAAVRA